MKKQTFLLPQKITLETLPNQLDKEGISYYSDCVFKPFIHYFQPNEFQVTESQQKQTIVIDFEFILKSIESFPKILDNIGVLKLGNKLRYGILVTKQKEGLFVSIID